MKTPLLSAVCFGLLTCVPALHIRAQGTPPPSQATPPPTAASKLDFGDFSSSALTTKAWGALEAKNYDDAIAYTGKCIDMYKAKAVEMQKALPAPTTDKDQTFAQWALNDVGTAYFIQAKALEAQGKQKDALESYKFLANNLAYAQCWDTKGWFWKPADAAKERLKALEFDSLK